MNILDGLCLICFAIATVLTYLFLRCDIHEVNPDVLIIIILSLWAVSIIAGMVSVGRCIKNKVKSPSKTQ